MGGVRTGKKLERRVEFDVSGRHRPSTAVLSIRDAMRVWKDVGKRHRPAVGWARVTVKEENKVGLTIH